MFGLFFVFDLPGRRRTLNLPDGHAAGVARSAARLRAPLWSLANQGHVGLGSVRCHARLHGSARLSLAVSARPVVLLATWSPLAIQL